MGWCSPNTLFPTRLDADGRTRVNPVPLGQLCNPWRVSDDAARRAMHVLLDMVASQDLSAPDEANLLASRTAFEGFDRDAIEVTEDHDTGEIVVNPTALITASGTAIILLVGMVASDRGQDPLTVLNTLREHLDGVLAE